VSPEARAVLTDAHEEIQTLIDEEGFSFTASELTDFLVRAIPLRELAKFEFTRNISAALTLLRSGSAEQFALDPSELSALTLPELLEPVAQNRSPVIERRLERAINYNRKTDRIQEYVQLPPVITDASDVRAFEVSSEQPNYVTNEAATAETVQVEQRSELDTEDLDGRIVLIPSADPGYDWIFGADIAGLVTKYGGVASHMAIRAAEFGLPAAIGCGTVLYDDIATAAVVELDCDDEQLREVR
jgi:phosphohistidine swiveling domain-containing protein